MVKIIKIGSSLGLTLSSELLKKLKIKKGDEVNLHYNRKKGIIELEPELKVLNSADGFLNDALKLSKKYSHELEKLDSEW